MNIVLVRGDITEETTDAIVNAANSSLLGGGGVDGAIHRKGGKAILDDCRKVRARQGKCKTGEAVITTAGLLPSKYVIHTVGPAWCGGAHDEPQKLENCYLNSLRLAHENGIESIAFPNISTGIFGYPKNQAAELAIATVRQYGAESTNGPKTVRFVCFDQENYELYAEMLK